MASGLHQWESDPLFSAAEVVQDSADRFISRSLFILIQVQVFPLLLETIKNIDLNENPIRKEKSDKWINFENVHS